MQLGMLWGLLSYGKFGALDVNYSSLVKLSMTLGSSSLLGRRQFLREWLGKITFFASLMSVVMTTVPSLKLHLLIFGVQTRCSTLAGFMLVCGNSLLLPSIYGDPS